MTTFFDSRTKIENKMSFVLCQEKWVNFHANIFALQVKKIKKYKSWDTQRPALNIRNCFELPSDLLSQ